MHYATSRKVAGSIPDEVIGFFNWPNHSSRTVALGSTQSATEMNTRNLPGGKRRPADRPAHKADNLTAICDPLDASQSYGPPPPITGIVAFTSIFPRNVGELLLDFTESHPGI
jgi:hypothetical protein